MNTREITEAIKMTEKLSFKKKIKNVSSPYGKGGAGKKIVKILKKVNLKNIKLKKFFDLKLS